MSAFDVRHIADFSKIYRKNVLYQQPKHSNQNKAPLSFSVSKLPNDKDKRWDFVTCFTYVCSWLQQQQPRTLRIAVWTAFQFSGVLGQQSVSTIWSLVQWRLVCYLVCPFIIVVLKLVLVAFLLTTQHLQANTYTHNFICLNCVIPKQKATKKC